MSKQKPLVLAPTLSPGVALGIPDARPPLPKIKSVKPFGSKILVETLRNDEISGSSLYVGDAKTGDGAPQALIISIGPNLDPNCGLKVGQRVYWTGKGTLVEDPTVVKGRSRALLEIANIIAIIEEETEAK